MAPLNKRRSKRVSIRFVLK